MKICSKCRAKRELSEFYDHIKTCKPCLVKKRAYYQANKDKYKGYKKTANAKIAKIKNDEIKEFNKFKKANKSLFDYLAANKIKLKRHKNNLRKRLWAAKNPEKIQATRKRTAKAKNAYEKNRMANDPIFKLLKFTRHRIRLALKANRAVRCDSSTKLLGSSVIFARKWIESQFLPGMTWENHGEWHIDHIKPCAAFDLTDPKQQRECFNFKNLQPLWAFDNLSKGDRF